MISKVIRSIVLLVPLALAGCTGVLVTIPIRAGNLVPVDQSKLPLPDSVCASFSAKGTVATGIKVEQSLHVEIKTARETTLKLILPFEGSYRDCQMLFTQDSEYLVAIVRPGFSNEPEFNFATVGVLRTSANSWDAVFTIGGDSELQPQLSVRGILGDSQQLVVSGGGEIKEENSLIVSYALFDLKGNKLSPIYKRELHAIDIRDSASPEKILRISPSYRFDTKSNRLWFASGENEYCPLTSVDLIGTKFSGFSGPGPGCFMQPIHYPNESVALIVSPTVGSEISVHKVNFSAGASQRIVVAEEEPHVSDYLSHDTLSPDNQYFAFILSRVSYEFGPDFSINKDHKLALFQVEPFRLIKVVGLGKRNSYATSLAIIHSGQTVTALIYWWRSWRRWFKWKKEGMWETIEIPIAGDLITSESQP